jgi:hypothetical protein
VACVRHICISATLIEPKPAIVSGVSAYQEQDKTVPLIAESRALHAHAHTLREKVESACKRFVDNIVVLTRATAKPQGQRKGDYTGDSALLHIHSKQLDATNKASLP